MNICRRRRYPSSSSLFIAYILFLFYFLTFEQNRCVCLWCMYFLIGVTLASCVDQVPHSLGFVTFASSSRSSTSNRRQWVMYQWVSQLLLSTTSSTPPSLMYRSLLHHHHHCKRHWTYSPHILHSSPSLSLPSWDRQQATCSQSVLHRFILMTVLC